MRTVTRTLLTTGAALIWVAAVAAQAPSPHPAKGTAEVLTVVRSAQLAGPVRSPAAVIERLRSFDVDADGRITGDELPERMQGLVARGDKNTDAALDADEIGALVNAASSERRRVVFQSRAPEGLPGVISDLKLPPAKHARAIAIVGSHKPPRNIDDPASNALLGEMKDLLDDEEYENFLAAATRLSRGADIRFRIDSGVVGGVRRPSGPK